MYNVATEFVVRRMAQFARIDDLDSLGNMLILIYGEDYQTNTAEEMMDSLLDLKVRIGKLICKPEKAISG